MATTVETFQALISALAAKVGGIIKLGDAEYRLREGTAADWKELAADGEGGIAVGETQPASFVIAERKAVGGKQWARQNWGRSPQEAASNVESDLRRAKTAMGKTFPAAPAGGSAVDEKVRKANEALRARQAAKPKTQAATVGKAAVTKGARGRPSGANMRRIEDAQKTLGLPDKQVKEIGRQVTGKSFKHLNDAAKAPVAKKLEQMVRAQGAKRAPSGAIPMPGKVPTPSEIKRATIKQLRGSSRKALPAASGGATLGQALGNAFKKTGGGVAPELGTFVEPPTPQAAQLQQRLAETVAKGTPAPAVATVEEAVKKGTKAAKGGAAAERAVGLRSLRNVAAKLHPNISKQQAGQLGKAWSMWGKAADPVTFAAEHNFKGAVFTGRGEIVDELKTLAGVSKKATNKQTFDAIAGLRLKDPTFMQKWGATIKSVAIPIIVMMAAGKLKREVFDRPREREQEMGQLEAQGGMMPSAKWYEMQALMQMMGGGMGAGAAPALPQQPQGPQIVEGEVLVG